ncbi:MAG: hypothetical protein JWL76_1194 [Thermoleophilia bacterium]|nr:hypothetical protein [Thermoleophilia bacterium]
MPSPLNQRQFRRALVLCGLVVAVALGTSAHGASSNVTVNLDVLSWTSVDSAVCAATPSAVSFGTALPNDKLTTTADCRVAFDSNSPTASLHLRQADRAGNPMWRLPVGTFDQGFDGASGTGNGFVSLDLGGQHDNAVDVDVDSQQRVVIARRSVFAAIKTSITRLDANGVADPSFGTSGTWQPVSGNHREPTDTELFADDSVAWVGTWWNGANMDVVAGRLTPLGQTDTSFSGPDGQHELHIGTGDNTPSGLALDEAGNYVIAGSAQVAGSEDVAMYRLSSTGVPDVTFDGPSGTGNGSFTFSVVAGNEHVEDVRVQADGRIIVSGSVADGRLFVARLLSNGALDPTFDGPTGIGNGIVIHDLPGSPEVAYAVEPTPDGRILFSGIANDDLLIGRLEADGDLDPLFAGDGSYARNIGGQDIAFDLALQENGSILVVGRSLGSQAWTARVDTTGSADLSFDGPTGTGNGLVAVNFPGVNDQGIAVDVVDGAPVIAGRGDNATEDTAVAKIAASSIPSYDGGAASWTSAPMFGACLRATTAASATWTPHISCPTTNGVYWKGVAPTTSQIASKSGAGSSVDLRFGVHVGNTTGPGAYVAPLEFVVMAP